jgi:hypothetical protein
MFKVLVKVLPGCAQVSALLLVVIHLLTGRYASDMPWKKGHQCILRPELGVYCVVCIF